MNSSNIWLLAAFLFVAYTSARQIQHTKDGVIIIDDDQSNETDTLIVYNSADSTTVKTQAELDAVTFTEASYTSTILTTTMKTLENIPEKPIAGNWVSLWAYALGSTLLISVAPFLLLFFINLDNTDVMKPRLKVLLAFASGGLLGDAFLHLIPHALHPHSHERDGVDSLSHSHDHDHDHEHGHNHEHEHEHGHTHDMSIGLWVLIGIITFLIVEKCVRLIKSGQFGSRGSPLSPDEIPEKYTKPQNEMEVVESSPENKENDAQQRKSCGEYNVLVFLFGQSVSAAGYLNLVADFTHNFTDGLAIGASYLAGHSIGLITTIIILLHEVPHEIGDIAILIKSGCPKRKAMFLQLLTAIGAILGTIIVLLGGNSIAASWILPFTAGGFIYIATVSVLPDLLEDSTKLGQTLKEIGAFLVGIGLMIVIARLE